MHDRRPQDLCEGDKGRLAGTVVGIDPLQGRHGRQDPADVLQIGLRGSGQVQPAGDHGDGRLENPLHVGDGVEQPGVAAAADQGEMVAQAQNQGHVVGVSIGDQGFALAHQVVFAFALHLGPLGNLARGPHAGKDLLRLRVQPQRQPLAQILPG